MGFDIIGLEPKSKKGRYFRINVWWWRPIWFFTCLAAVKCLKKKFTKDFENAYGQKHTVDYFGYEAGWNNDGLVIPKAEAEEIGKTILRILNPPDPVEAIANGFTGNRKFEKLRDLVRRRTSPEYATLTESVLQEWAEFCIDSGGFEIC